MGPTSLVKVPTRSNANDLAMIELVHTSMIVLWLVNLFGIIGQLKQWRLHNQSRPHPFRWLMVHKNSFSVRQCKVFAQFEVLPEPISSTDFAVFDVLCARIGGFLLAVQPEVNVCLSHQSFPESRNFSRGDHHSGNSHSPFSYHGWMKCTRFPLMSKKRCWDVIWLMWLLHLYDSWRFESS